MISSFIYSESRRIHFAFSFFYFFFHLELLPLSLIPKAYAIHNFSTYSTLCVCVWFRWQWLKSFCSDCLCSVGWFNCFLHLFFFLVSFILHQRRLGCLVTLVCASCCDCFHRIYIYIYLLHIPSIKYFNFQLSQETPDKHTIPNDIWYFQWTPQSVIIIEKERR